MSIQWQKRIVVILLMKMYLFWKSKYTAYKKN